MPSSVVRVVIGVGVVVGVVAVVVLVTTTKGLGDATTFSVLQRCLFWTQFSSAAHTVTANLMLEFLHRPPRWLLRLSNVPLDVAIEIEINSIHKFLY